MTVIAVCNMKGGTGKTTLSRELGYQFAKHSPTLLIDLDPQASLTKTLVSDEPSITIGDVLNKKATIRSAAVNVRPNLDLVPSNQLLTTVDIDLRSQPSGHFALGKALKAIEEYYRFVIIDTIPTFSELNVNALLAAQALVIPLQPQGTDVQALPGFLKMVEGVQEVPTAQLNKVGIVPMRYNDQFSHHRAVVEALRQTGHHLFSVVGQSIRVAEAATQRKFLPEIDTRNPRTLEIEQLAKEVEAWLQ